VEEPGGNFEIRLSYDRVAERYATEIAGELRGKPLDRALLAMLAELAEGGVTADIGCGPGHVTDYVTRLGARTVGLDLSPGMCSVAARTSSAPFCAADMTSLPIRSNSLGAIISFYAVIHLDIRDRSAAYREFARTLRPGGHALIAFHSSDPDVPVGGSKHPDALVGSRSRTHLPISRPGRRGRPAGRGGAGTHRPTGSEPVSGRRAPQPPLLSAGPEPPRP
jgi:SAM-dependent methyltransferase